MGVATPGLRYLRMFSSEIWEMLFVGLVDDVALYGQTESQEASKRERQNLHWIGIAAFEKTSASKQDYFQS